MTQRRKSLEHDTVLVAKLEQLPFWEIWIGFYVDNGRLYPRGFKNPFRLFPTHVRQSDGLTPALVRKTLQSSPRIQQRHPLHHKSLCRSRPSGLPRLQVERQTGCGLNRGRRSRVGVALDSSRKRV